MSGKMSLEKWFVDRHRLHAYAFRSAFIETQDPIDHQKWITMRQNLDDLVRVEAAIAFRNNSRNGERVASRSFLCDRAREVRICGVSRFYRDEMSTNSTTDQREVADNVEDFVPNELVWEPQRFFAQHRITTDHDRVFQTAAFDEIFLHQRLDIFVINKCPCRCDLALENFRRDIGRQELGEAIVRTR